jgi:hypothetical protein
MSKNRSNKQRKSKPQSPKNRPAAVHRYSAEDEERKDNRKKLKIKGIIALVVAAPVGGIGLLVNFLVF